MKKIVVLVRENADEAMRVAAGLTIFGHEVGCVLVNHELEIDSNNEYLEMLDLADIELVVLDGVKDNAIDNNELFDRENDMRRRRKTNKNLALFQPISCNELGQAMNESDAVLSF